MASNKRTADGSPTSGRGSTAYPPNNGRVIYGPGEDYRDSFREPLRRSERGAVWREGDLPVYKRRRFIWPLAFLLGMAAMVVAMWAITPQGQETIKESIKVTQRLVQPELTLTDSFGAPRMSVLFVGLDHIPSRKGERVNRHSDSVMLANVDLDTKQVRMVSIPRDGWVEQRNANGKVSTDKLAHSYSSGQNQNWDDPQSGVRNTIDAVQRLVQPQQPIDYFVVVDPNGFAELVEAIGGIEVDVEKRMKYRDRRGGLNIDLQPGLQRLDGEQAMGYVRFRYDALSDLARMGRQQKVMRIILEELKKPENLPRLPQLFSIFQQHVKTNLSLDQLLALAQHIDEFDSESVQSMTIENYGRNDGPAYPLTGEPWAQWAQYIPPSAVDDAREFLSNLEPPVPQLNGVDELERVEASDDSGLVQAGR